MEHSDQFFDIAVIGGGFCGLMVIANLVNNAKTQPRLFWNDSTGPLGRGIAYGTAEPCHLLNVRADRMGAWSDQIDDFWLWLQQRYPGTFQPGSYVPRMIYGEYLDGIRQHSLGKTPVTTSAVAITAITHASRNIWRIHFADHRPVTCRHLVLATGNPAIASLGWPETAPYINDFWGWRRQHPGSLITEGLTANDTIIIAGTGLTMTDATLSCLNEDYKGSILALSPHGLIPAAHHDPVASYEQKAELEAEIRKTPAARHYFRTVRAHLSSLPDDDGWRGVIDSLRPHITPLWQALPETEKRRFMRHLWPLWNIHRHRMAPEVTARLTGNPRIHIAAGRVVETLPDGSVSYRLRNGEIKTCKAGRVINCTGPNYRQMIAANPPLASLMEQNLLRLGPLGLGIATPDAPGLHAIGTILLGERLETTAVPELRGQAAAIAAAILDNVEKKTQIPA